MKTFLGKLLTFLAPLMLIVLLFEIYLRSVDTLYTRKIDGLLAHADSIELLILGNSHACFGINPLQFDVFAYNLAQSNQSLYFDKRLTLKYLTELVKLKFVFISVDFHSLYFSSQGMRDSWSYYGHGIEYKSQMNLLQKASYTIGYTPKVAFSFLKNELFAKRMESFARPADVDESAHGFNPDYKGWVYFEGTTIPGDPCKSKAAVFNNTVKNSSERAENLADLDDFIDQLKRRNITPVLINSPAYYELNLLLDEKISEQNKSDIDFLTRKHNIQFWDFNDFQITKDDFFNCDHLNRNGADKFSKELNLRLRKLVTKF